MRQIIIVVVTILSLSASASARADSLSGFFAETATKLLAHAGAAVVNTVKEAVIPKDPQDDQQQGDSPEVQKLLEQALSSIPEPERAAKRPEILAQIRLVEQQFKASAARRAATYGDESQEAPSIGSSIVDLAMGAAAKTVVGSPVDRAADIAFARTRARSRF